MNHIEDGFTLELNKMFSLKGKKALVTGGARGLGRGMANGLYKAGADIVILDISDEIEKIQEEFVGRENKVYAVKADLSNRENRRHAFHQAIELLEGELDILVNAAGIIDRSPAIDLSLDDWDKVLEVNVSAVFELCKWAGEIMLKQNRGKIINVASMLSFSGGLNANAYAASKGGVAQLTKALSNEWAIHGIQVNAVAPGYMETKMNTFYLENPIRHSQITARIPSGRWGKPEDMEGITVFLASEAANYITGSVIPVCGGYLSR